MKMSAEEYGRRVRRVGPPSPLGGDCLWAFGVGGSICLLGEVLRGWYLTMGLDKELAGTLTSCTLVALSALLTTLGLYQKLAAKAGAGTLVPITALPMQWSVRPSSSRPRAVCWGPARRCSSSPGRSSYTVRWRRFSTAASTGCCSKSPPAKDTHKEVRKLHFHTKIQYTTKNR